MSMEAILALLTQDLTAGSLQVRLAENEAEIDEAQALRYSVFYEELGAKPNEEMLRRKRDFDTMDACCEHLLVVDNNRPEGERVIGTYRLIRREHAKKHGSFYSESEYDVSPIIAYPGEILELGRSCIHKDYRSGTVMSLLWKALAAHMFRYDIKIMFGCASLHGTDLEKHAPALSYLYHHHLAPPAIRPKALPGLHIDMNILPPEAYDPEKTFNDLEFNAIRASAKKGRANLPPLIKGYLRVGCTVGDGAFVDHQFNTTDVAIVFKTELITNRYLRHYNRILGNMDEE